MPTVLSPVWDAKAGTSSRVIPPDQDVAIREIAWNRGGVIAALDDNDSIRVVPAEKTQPTISIPINTRAGQHLAWASNDSEIAVPVGENGVISYQAPAPDGKIATLGDDHQGQAWASPQFRTAPVCSSAMSAARSRFGI